MDKDPGTTNPLGEQDPLGLGGDEGLESEEYQLMEVAHGRMLCIVHGRVCYRRVTITGENEWICPDERHPKVTDNS